MVHLWDRELPATMAAICIGLSVPLSQIGISYTTSLLAAACLFVLLHHDRRRCVSEAARALKSPVGVSLAIVFAAWIPSLFTSIDPGKSLQVWARTAAYLALGALLWAFLKGESVRFQICRRALFAASALSVFLIAVNFLVGPEYIRILRFKEFVEGYPTLVMKLYAAPAACLVPILICVGWCWGRSALIVGIGLALVLIFFSYLTKSGSAVVGLAFGFYCAGITWWGRRDGRIVLIGMALLSISLVAWYVWFALSDPLTVDLKQLEHDSNLPFTLDQHRQLIWQFIFSKLPDAIWTGYGIDAINKLPEAREIIPILGGEVLPSHPHSWVFEILAETGLVGFVPFLCALGTAFCNVCWRALKGSQPALAATGLFGVYFGAGLFSFSFWASWWQLVFIAFWAILAAMDELHRKDMVRPDANRPPV